MSGLPVLTAVTGAPWEARLVAGLERSAPGITVVRRCVDLADLLAEAAAGAGRAVLLSADLRRLDREALTRLAAAGVAVVGLVTTGDEEAERRLRQLGVETVLPGNAPPEAIADAVAQAVTALGESPGETARAGRALGDPRSVLPADPPGPAPAPAALPGTGRLVAVWGPTGAPGRSSIAVNLAAELARRLEPSAGSALLVDADVYGGVAATLLGLLDEAPGLAAAARLANAGSLDVPRLAALAPIAAPALRVLTGIGRADRWPELRPSSVAAVLTLARSLAEVTVVDCAFCLEQDEELVYDTMAPRRNGVTTTVLAEADVVVAVCAADPVGVQRFVRAVGQVRDLAPDARLVVVANKVRTGPVGSSPEEQVRRALDRYAGLSTAGCVPWDPGAFDASLRAGRVLGEVATSSAARSALVRLAAELGEFLALPGPSRTRRSHRR